MTATNPPRQRLVRGWAIERLLPAWMLAFMLFGAPYRAAAESPRVFSGPFDLRQSLYFYVVNTSGAAFTISMKSSDPMRAGMDRPLLVRVFDPQEHKLIRHDAPGAKGPTEQTLKLDVPASGAGVYQVAITGFTASIDFTTNPPLSFGVFGYPQLACRGEQFADARVYVPPGTDVLEVRTGEQLQSLTLTDQSGQARIALNGQGAGQTNVAGQAGQVWRLSAKAAAGAVGTLNFAGMPVIVCPDDSSAQAIHASVDVLDDGVICFHKFQARAHELLKRYRAMPLSAFDVRAPVLIRDKADWLADPVRNRLLLGPYGVFSGLDTVLSEQNLRGDSPWFGTIHSWRDQAGRERADSPWTRCDRLGLSRVASTVGTLAAVYSVHERFNRLAGNAALRDRIIIASLQELMLLREHELPLPQFDEYFGGERAFTLASFTLAFPLFIRDCPEDVRAVLTEGLGRCVDHETISNVADIVNQWSFIVRGIQHYREGVDDAWYGEIVSRHVRWILTRNFFDFGFMPAGYFAEGGPDATYIGITLHNLGYVYKQTRDAELKDALRKSMDLFNHTVAPEPDGSWQCATSFSTRTPGGWSAPQWGAGIGMLADDFAEAAPLVGRAWFTSSPPDTGPALHEAERLTTAALTPVDKSAFTSPNIGEKVLMDAGMLAFPVWRYFAQQPLAGTLPMVESTSFTRGFSDEFMCVRRPGYYAFIYAGKPMADWNKPRRPRDPQHQWPRNGGGLCLFWTPGFGSSLVAKNWSAYAAQSLIAQRADGADWEDYWSVQTSFDVDRAAARVTSSLLDQPVKVTRDVRFLQDAVRMELTLAVQMQPNATTMWESFPYPLDKPRPLRVRLLDEHGHSVQDRPATAICFEDGGPECHLIVFDRPRMCELRRDRSTDLYNHSHEHGCVLAQVPGGTDVGTTSVRWMMLGVSVERAAQAITEAVAHLNTPASD